MSANAERAAHHNTRRELLPGRPDWMADALCAETWPDAFYPDKGESAREAKDVCNGTERAAPCPVRDQCLAMAIANNELYGVWGGLSERERQDMRRATRQGEPVPAPLPAPRVRPVASAPEVRVTPPIPMTKATPPPKPVTPAPTPAPAPAPAPAESQPARPAAKKRTTKPGKAGQLEFDHDHLRSLKAEGLTVRQIADRLGIDVDLARQVMATLPRRAA